MDKKEMNEHILVCLSPSPSNTKIIEAASKMVEAFNANFTALYVKTTKEPSKEDRQRLNDNVKFAQDRGATIESVFGDDVAYQIIEYSRLSHVTKIVVGKSRVKGLSNIKPTLVDKLIAQAGNVDVYIIPDTEDTRPAPKEKEPIDLNALKKDLLKSFVILSITTLISYLFFEIGFADSSIMMVYILGVMIIAMITQGKAYSLITSALIVVIFNFLFTEPRFTLKAYASEYPVTFLVMFFAALITGTLAGKLKDFASESTRNSYRTKILFDTNQLLQNSTSSEEIVTIMAKQIQKLLSKSVIVYIKENGKIDRPYVFMYNKEDPSKYLNDHEFKVAQWVCEHNKQAGAFTVRFTDSSCLHLSIRVNQQGYGVVSIPIDEPIEPFENSILLSILGESALAMENYRNVKDKEESIILAENERTRANMLRSISHDLRTPLTSILGNASNLLSNAHLFDEKTKSQIYLDIYDESWWLINLVENLLSVTKIEDGDMHLNFSYELINEIVEEALKHVDRHKIEHKISIHSEDDLMLVKVDSRLMVQVFVNLIDNAIKYTPKGSHIDVFILKKEEKVLIRVQDDGPGISDEDKEHIFERYYQKANTLADSRRSLGLGLALCRSIINAHGHEIVVKDNVPHGTIFEFTLSSKEVVLDA